MTRVIFLAHFPTLRTGAESIPFGAGDLWAMPFDVFDDLSAGAFSDHQAEYDAAAPVFYRVAVNLELPYLKPEEHPEPGKQTVIEAKARANDRETLERMGLGFFDAFHAQFAGPAWAALTLAAPASALPLPRLSATFAVARGEDRFHIATSVSRTVRVQGEADLEYLFLSKASGAVMPEEAIGRANSLLGLTERIEAASEIGAALDLLLTAGAPPLESAEQMTLAVMALEALLMPDVHTGLGRTFANRLGSLLARGEEDAGRLRKCAMELYHLRSASLHGGRIGPGEAGSGAVSQAHAQQLLGAAIAAMAERAAAEPLDEVRESLDAPGVIRQSGTQLPESVPPALRAPDRVLLRVTGPVTGFHSGRSLQAEKDQLLSWSPLTGLTAEDPVAICGPQTAGIGEAAVPVLVPLSGPEVLGLEDRDIRRDFISELYTAEGNVAAMAIAMPAREYAGIAGAELLLRSRDLAVVALRLAGFRRFQDPSLLGAYIYSGAFQYRQGSVFRQTILENLRRPGEEQITPADAERSAASWALLARYENEARHPEIDALLTSFRRVFDRHFIPWRSRAALLVSALEAMLGRFRPRTEKIQLEDLIEAVTGEIAATAWFRQHGREFRNAVAHGEMPKPGEAAAGIERILDVVSALIPFLLESWLAAGDRATRRPGSVMIQYANARLR